VKAVGYRITAHGQTLQSSHISWASTVGRVRIIGGRWRGRKLSVADVPGLRPTGDRIRETLFNWLQMAVPGARCLDLFAGSGALGLEAASRDAAAVTLVESNPIAAQVLRQHMSTLQVDGRVQLQHTDAQAFLATNTERFDVVFVDPPFAAHLQSDILHTLDEQHLQRGALVYIEAPRSSGIEVHFTPRFSVYRQRNFGDVAVYLLTYD